MIAVTFDKYLRNPGIRKQLIETGTKHLEELNNWNDTFWGVDPKVGGQNNLGKIIMNVREFWLRESKINK
jgi:predicted NAD-dependent protein-ADP-ribosyltransferase YbiA (DUF1768 family)